MTDTPVRVGHLRIGHGGVDKYRTRVWKQVFLDNDIPVFDLSQEQAAVNVAYVSHPTTQYKYNQACVLLEKGLPIVFGIDDDYRRIHKDNKAYKYTRKSWAFLRDVASFSSAVIVTTEKLAEQYEQYSDNVHVIPNYIPNDHIRKKGLLNFKQMSGNFGWAGSLDTHPVDLDVFGFAVRDLCADYSFHHIGPGKVSPIVNAPVWEHGPQTTEGYLDKIFEVLDVGLAPLARSKFNDAKSYLKPLEYSALGVPWVASPARDYRRIHDEYKVGMLASKPRDWKAAVRKLFEDEAFYRQQQADAYEWAKTQTIEKNYTDWLDAFESALDK